MPYGGGGALAGPWSYKQKYWNYYTYLHCTSNTIYNKLNWTETEKANYNTDNKKEKKKSNNGVELIWPSSDYR